MPAKPTTLTTAQAAEMVGTDPKTLRVYLRTIKDEDTRPGKGSRYELTKTEVTKKIKPGFEKWLAARNEARTTRKASKPAPKPKAAKADKASKQPENDDNSPSKLTRMQADKARAKIARGDEPNEFEQSALDETERFERSEHAAAAKAMVDDIMGADEPVAAAS